MNIKPQPLTAAPAVFEMQIRALAKFKEYKYTLYLCDKHLVCYRMPATPLCAAGIVLAASLATQHS